MTSLQRGRSPESPTPPASPPDACPTPVITHWQELIDNLPYLAMLALGAAIFLVGPGGPTWRWVVAVGYVAYGVIGAFWIMAFVCPYCRFYGTRLCPCGYGWIAAKMRARRDPQRFAGQFRKHIPVIVPLWFLPLMAAGMGLYRAFSGIMLALLVGFVVCSFVLLPLLSRHYGCARCPQKRDCPWMGGCGAAEPKAGMPASCADPVARPSTTAESNE